ncbi:recombinase family protein [Pelagibacterium montanilacus]|uniref:recombinase family protein n=1 Tax=Pelagibacterium montanilacus TaxID=2185280 RepID=UPI000F8E49F6|nr:recombinase family protein [Pelagibacterium montanilacus]
MSAPPHLRCAIYTRKSTEDGLEQEFNSLDAQREACEAYIVSQGSLGWRLLADRYDDGGISGGTMERPGLKRLLADLRDGKVDVVVVYKIDRLTRSLFDFARLVDILDGAKASFVSVTQQFNTTTSMGRLTLNVLLSFAQFEREVTAERIRDKIAASKRKGMWMGGAVPLGYRAKDRKLRIDEGEATIVRYLFGRYLELGSVRALVAEANAERFPARRCPDRKGAALADADTSTASERQEGQDGQVRSIAIAVSEADPDPQVRTFSRGHLYHLLSNPIYIGKVRHKGVIHQGEHAAIIEPETFARAERLLATQAPARKSATNATDLHLLTGLIHDENGTRLRSVHTRRGDMRYRYYVSKALVEERGRSDERGWRLPAREIEQAFEMNLLGLFTDPRRLANLVEGRIPAASIPALIKEASKLALTYRQASPQDKRATIRTLITRIELTAARMVILIDTMALAAALGHQPGNADRSTASSRDGIDIGCPIALRRRGKETRIVLSEKSQRTAAPDATLIGLIRRAHHYLTQLTDGSGRTISDIASVNNVDRSDVGRALRLAFLAPSIVDKIIAGTQPADLTAHKLSRLAELPASWAEQQKLFET